MIWRMMSGGTHTSVAPRGSGIMGLVCAEKIRIVSHSFIEMGINSSGAQHTFTLPEPEPLHTYSKTLESIYCECGAFL